MEPNFELSREEFANLKSAFLDKGVIRDNIFLHTNPKVIDINESFLVVSRGIEIAWRGFGYVRDGVCSIQ